MLNYPLISGFLQYFNCFNGCGAVPKRALPIRHAPIVLNPIPQPFNDRLRSYAHGLGVYGVEGLLAPRRCPESEASDVDVLRAMFLFDAAGWLSFSDVGWVSTIFMDPGVGLRIYCRLGPILERVVIDILPFWPEVLF